MGKAGKRQPQKTCIQLKTFARWFPKLCCALGNISEPAQIPKLYEETHTQTFLRINVFVCVSSCTSGTWEGVKKNCRARQVYMNHPAKVFHWMQFLSASLVFTFFSNRYKNSCDLQCLHSLSANKLCVRISSSNKTHQVYLCISTLFYSILFYSDLFHSGSISSVLFLSILLWSILF